MAGNLPLVGFHDLLCVLLSGHVAVLKLSSSDNVLMKFVVQCLVELNPAWAERIIISENKLDAFDAVIATGSNNSSRYFDYYFARYPHIIRKNRHSIAVINGDETDDELRALADDIFLYYGLGCRNVSLLCLPKGYEAASLLSYFSSYASHVNHTKYFNNYEYFKAINIINNIPFLDNGFVLLQESNRLSSPIGTVHYMFYESLSEMISYTETLQNDLQCVVSHLPELPNAVLFGRSQFPALNDYADNIDTMRFLSELY